jgi:coenzyme F420-reducing hydrogenase delta subunit
VESVRELLEDIGLEGRRIQMINVSSAMGGQFAWSAAEMTEEIRRMGPNPLKAENGRLAQDTPSQEPVSTETKSV